uniref:Uncharacterized protein n=1 Tax=Picea sitchensis TaxID=3332 RepID=A9NXC2_PICSI|nr:unknown [Picea sitchensis]
MRRARERVERPMDLVLAPMSKQGIFYVRNKGKSTRHTRNYRMVG